MSTKLLRTLFVATIGAASLNTLGCDVHDNTVNIQASLDFKADVDVSQVKPGDSVAVTMNATGVVLVDPKTTPSNTDAATAAYFQIYLDDVDSDPLLVTAQASAQVTIPKDTSDGKHKLICRLHKHDGTPTDQKQEVSITVKASASVMTGADAGM